MKISYIPDILHLLDTSSNMILLIYIPWSKPWSATYSFIFSITLLRRYRYVSNHNTREATSVLTLMSTTPNKNRIGASSSSTTSFICGNMETRNYESILLMYKLPHIPQSSLLRGSFLRFLVILVSTFLNTISDCLS